MINEEDNICIRRSVECVEKLEINIQYSYYIFFTLKY